LTSEINSIDAVLFDMDGVVVDSMPSHFQTWQSVLHDSGISVSMEDIYRREGMTGILSVRDIFLDKKAPLPDDEDVQDIMSRKHELFEGCNISLFPQIGIILDCLKSRGLKLALVTGSSKRAVRHVLPDDVSCLFDAIITSEDVVRGKPDPEPYVTALEALSVPASRSLVIENAPMGVQSAGSAGIKCIALETTLEKSWLLSADLVFPDHDSLREYLCPGIKN